MFQEKHEAVSVHVSIIRKYINFFYIPIHTRTHSLNKSDIGIALDYMEICSNAQHKLKLAE